MAEKKKKTGRPAYTFEEFVQRPPKFSILTDQPLKPDEAFDADTFNFRYKLGPLFDILRSPDTRTPMAVLISGDWGTGKTSAMKWLHGLLDKWNVDVGRNDTKVHPVWFYPWKYDNKEDVRKGLIARVIINAVYIRNPENKQIKINSKKILTGLKLLGSFGLNVINDLVSASEYEIPFVPGLSISGEALKDVKKHFTEAAHPEAAFLNELEEAMKHWVEGSLGKKQRMVIFIDDLDRCMPDIALQVLEALKLYLNIPNLIFVLGVDKEVVEKLVVEYYRKLGLVKSEEKKKDESKEEKPRSRMDNASSKQDEEKAKQYLSKMFQVEVTLDPSEQQVGDFFVKQLKKLTYWDEKYLSQVEQEIFRELVLDFAGRNPREVKRLLNSALMTGAGAIMIKKDGIGFNQGMQLFFVRKILDEKYTMASEAGSSRGIDFFVEWSGIVRKGKEKHENFPFTINVPSDFGIEPQKELDLVEKTRKRMDNLFASFAPDEYHDLLKNSRFFGLFHLLADKDLGKLMQIPYPTEAAEVAAVVGISKDDEIVREVLARQLNKKPDELTEDDYRKTTGLDLSRSGITDISILKSFTNLQTLGLYGTQVINIGVLSGLTGLQWLKLDGAQVIDIGALSGLTNLQELYLGDTQVRNIGALSGLTNLRKLSLSSTKVSDIGALSGLTNLQGLGLEGTQVSDIGALSGLTNLQTLDLSDTKVSDIGALSGLTNLQVLRLDDTQVSDIGALSGLTNLQRLYLGGTKVSGEQVAELKKALPKLNIYR